LYDEISLFDVETKTQKKIKIDKWQDQLTRVLHSDLLVCCRPGDVLSGNSCLIFQQLYENSDGKDRSFLNLHQVFGKNHNAYIRNLEDSTVVQLTFDGTLEFSYMTGWGDVKEEVPFIGGISDSEGRFV